MPSKKELAHKALDDAIRLRLSQGANLTTPIDIFSFATALDIDVRFVDIPSLEAMYVKGRDPLILISSHRPSGRQVYSCAHEIGHHIYDHGTKVDEYLETSRPKPFDLDEFLADRFASFLLMPKTLVNNAFYIRGWKIEECTPLEFYIISGWLGVGYSTLIYHMQASLNLLSRMKGQELLKTAPKSIRKDILNNLADAPTVVVDHHWTGRSVDVQVGEYIILPKEVSCEGKAVTLVDQTLSSSIYKGIAPGIGRFCCHTNGWATHVRVSRQMFVGRSIFRHLEDPDYE